MGYGDEIMAAGQAQRIYRETGRPAVIVDAQGKRRWSPLWRGLPAVVNPEADYRGDVEIVKNGPFCRPYIDRWGTEDGKPKAFYSDWRARDHRAELQLDELQELFRNRLVHEYGDYVVIEHRLKASASPNKDWGRDRWQEVATALGKCGPVLQLGQPEDLLEHIILVRTDTFLFAMAAIAGAALYVGPEGGLHHAAAAFRIPAVVVFGHMVSPVNTGYPDQTNLGRGAGCGRWAPCQNCKYEMDMIEPATVVERAVGLLKTSEGTPWAHS